MADKVAVITRKLPAHGDTVISRIVQIKAPSSDVDDLEHYQRSVAEEALKDERIRVETQFVEFRQAEWKVDIRDVETY